jgi:hypothetical protein
MTKIDLSTNNKVIFGGNNGAVKIGINTNSSDGYVNLSAGNTAIAPLKLTSGTNLTNVVNGAIEYDGTDLFFTIGGVRYKFNLTAV